MNKFGNWYVYQAHAPGGKRDTRKYRFAEWLTGAVIIDIALDVISVFAFGMALWMMFTVFA